MRYFVTGATGFVGTHVVRQLVADGHDVVALARAPERARGIAGPRVTIVRGDVTDRESIAAPMADVDGVFHIAGWYKVGARDRSPAQQINVDGTRNVLETMRELGVRKGVYTSTLAVLSDTRGRLVDETYRHDGPWLSEYDRTKAAAHYGIAEPMMRDGPPLVIVLPGVVYGPGDASRIGDTLRRYLLRTLPAVPRRLAFCWGHVQDTARGHLLAMERGRPGESYIIAGPPHTLLEALKTAERVTGVPVPRFRPRPGTMRFLAALMGLAGRFVTLSETNDPETLRVSAGITYLGDSSKAKRELGFRVRPLEDGLSETLRYEMARLGLRPPARSPG